VGWYNSTDERSRHLLRTYTGRDGQAPAWILLREAWASVAEMAIAPMQDFLALGNEARINTPGVAKGNWLWRLRDLPWYACDGLLRLSQTYGRI
jgi:4-alpha-glucanotransferase